MFKKLLLIAFLMGSMIAFTPQSSFAQDTTEVVEANPMPTKIAFGGLRWDNGAIGSYGTGIEAPFLKDFWVFTYADFGEDQSGNIEVAYLRNVREVFNDIPFLSKFPILSQIMNHTIFDKIIAGPILGPDFDITGGGKGSEGEDLGHTTYARYAVGFMGVYKIFDNSGAAGYVKRKLSFDNESNAGNNWVAGGALFIAF